MKKEEQGGYMRNIAVISFSVMFLSACSWHCTRGGQWSSYYASGDGRCTYFCADPAEKFCAATPLMAEALQVQAKKNALASNPEYQSQLEANRKQALLQDKATCEELGFRPDTDAMATCMLTQQQNRRNDAQSAENNFQQMNQRQMERQAEDRRQAGEMIRQGINNSKSLTCTTIGNTTTCR
jgi:hypothetical protein